MDDFHEDIQSKILSHVPVESLLNCKLVCKRWCQLLSNRTVSLGICFTGSYPGYFEGINLYYAGYDVIFSINRGEEDYYKTRIIRIRLPLVFEDLDKQELIVGSCNGLICLTIPYKGVYDPVYICNPFTTEYTYLPKLSYDDCDKSWNVVSGFGYLPSANEYKVVRIFYSSSTTKGLVQVYTLGRGSVSGWRNITEIQHSLHNEGILENESLYWKDVNNNKIVAFDLGDEIFRVLPSPPCIQFPREHTRVSACNVRWIYVPCRSSNL